MADRESPAAVNVRELRRSYRSPDPAAPCARRGAGAVDLEAGITTGSRRGREKNFARLRPALETIFRLKRDEADVPRLTRRPPTTPCSTSTSRGARAASLPRSSSALRGRARAAGGGDRRRRRRARHDDPPRESTRSTASRCSPRPPRRPSGSTSTRGRLDVTEHPFCTGIGPGDTRITTRYDLHNFSDAFFGVLHEVGHGLYDQGLDPAHHGTPMGEAVSLGVHESQSRLWENVVGRGRPFWTTGSPWPPGLPRGAERASALEPSISPINEVEPSLIRVQADEVTYNLHIIVRFELERALARRRPRGGRPARRLER